MRQLKDYEPWEPGIYPIHDQDLLDKLRNPYPKYEIKSAVAGFLPPREVEALFYAAQGVKAKIIAQLMGISKYAVDKYLQRLANRMGNSTSKTESALKAVAIGALPIDKLVDEEQQLMLRHERAQSPLTKKVTDLLVLNYGKRCSLKEMSATLAPLNVKNSIDLIKRKMSVADTTHLAIIRYSLDH